jgi:hypothetical protein
VVVVVPSIAKCEESNKEVISAIVSALIRATSVTLANRISRQDRMIYAYLAEGATPDDELKAIHAAVQKARVPCLTAQIQQHRIAQVDDEGMALKPN